MAESSTQFLSINIEGRLMLQVALCGTHRGIQQACALPGRLGDSQEHKHLICL